MGKHFSWKAVAVSAVLCACLLAGCGKTSYLQGSGESYAAEEDSGKQAKGSSSDEFPARDTDISGGASAEEAGDTSEASSAKADTSFFVEAAGAVSSPGVYRVPSGSRVFEVIALAGGLLPEADTSDINQAAAVTDGQKIYIRRQGEEAPPAASVSSVSGQNAGGLVNINTADAAALMTLPGVGQSKADAIISYRTKNGPFKKTTDLKKISGIKDGLYSKIADKITV